MIGSLCLLASVLSAPAATVEPTTHFYCNLRAFTPAEREAHGPLAQQVGGAVRELTELADGFALRIDSQQLPLATLATWVDGERRCCPFLRFDIVQEPGRDKIAGPLWLRLTGAPGVKDFLQAELGLGAKK